MDDKLKENPPAPLPFNNLFLNSGFVHGINHWSVYISAIAITLFFYFLAPLFTFAHLLYLAGQNGLSAAEIARDPNSLIDPKASGIDTNLILLGLFGIFVFAMVGLWIGVKKFHRKTMLSIMTGYEKFRFKRFWFAFLVWASMILVLIVMDYLLNSADFKVVFNLPGFIGSLLILLVFMPVQTAWEEFFFRGYLMQGLALAFKNGIAALVITSLLFGLAHMTNPEVDKYGWQMMLPYYCGFGLFFGLLTLLDEGIELALGLHLANNLISSILVTTSDSVIKTYSVFQTETTNPLKEIILLAVLCCIVFSIFWLRYRWKNFSLIIK